MRSMVLGVALLTFSSATFAQSMNAQTFFKRATALKKKGPLAIFSGGEIKALMNEGQASGKAAGAAYDADKKAGRPTRFCPPPGKRQMGSDEYMQRLAAIPAAERARINMTEATTRILTAKFPCNK
jgi:hypothetical protein